MWIDFVDEFGNPEPKIKRSFWKRFDFGDWWYRFKCFFWYRFTTIKPVTLNFHTWCDRSVLLPHIMFQILVDFIDNECSPGITDWEKSGHMIMSKNDQGVFVEKNVREAMQDLYDWWKECTSDFSECTVILDKKLRDEYELNSKEMNALGTQGFKKRGKGYTLFSEFDSEDQQKRYNKLIDRNEIIRRLDQELLIEKMQSLCTLHSYMWT